MEYRGDVCRRDWRCHSPTPWLAVDVAAVIRAIERPWRKTPVATDRLRNRITAASVRHRAEYRPGPNPGAWERLKHVLPSARKLRPIRHFAAMPWTEVPAFMAELRGEQGTRGRALEFLILPPADRPRCSARDGMSSRATC